MTLSKAAQKLREALKPTPPRMTQAGLANELGVTQQAVSAWLNGVTKPNAERIRQIEALLGVPASEWSEVPESGSDVAASDSPTSESEAAPQPEAAVGT